MPLSIRSSMTASLPATKAESTEGREFRKSYRGRVPSMSGIPNRTASSYVSRQIDCSSKTPLY